MIVFSMFIRYNWRKNNDHEQAIQLRAFIAKEKFLAEWPLLLLP